MRAAGIASALSLAACASAPEPEPAPQAKPRAPNAVGGLIGPRSPAHYAAALERSRRSLAAIEAKLRPDYRDLALAVRRVCGDLLQLKRCDEAVPCYDRFLAIVERNRLAEREVPAWFDKAVCLHALGREQEAQASAVRAAEAMAAVPWPPARKPGILRGLADAFARAGYPAGGIPALQRAYELFRKLRGADDPGTRKLADDLRQLGAEPPAEPTTNTGTGPP